MISCRNDIKIFIGDDDCNLLMKLKENRFVYLLLLECYMTSFDEHSNRIFFQDEELKDDIKELNRYVQKHAVNYSLLVSCCYADVKPHLSLLVKYGTIDVVLEIIEFCNRI